MSDTQTAIAFLESSDSSDLAFMPQKSVPVTMGGFHSLLRADRAYNRGPAFIPDLDYESQGGIKESLDAVRSGAPLVFISGRAGTGKSRLINYMKSMPGGETQVVVAPTGVAALALKASTIHSFFRLPIGVIAIDAMEEDQRFSRVIRKMKRLVIDEISMVRADILDGIDARLRMLRNPNRPFGGVQVVMVGDFLQLPPVVTEEDGALLSRLGYDTPFAFSAQVMQNTPIRVATLKKVWRQSDPEMISALGAIRQGKGVESAIGWLNAKCARNHRSDRQPLLLTARRDAADAYNETGISDLRQTFEDDEDNVFRLTAMSGGAFENERAVLPAPRVLELYPGTRVMSVKNDAAGEFVNGSLGEVVGFHHGHGVFEDTYVSVLFDGASHPTRMFPANWSKSQQTWNEKEDAIEETVTGFFEQVPLVVGYAITIHKSQGLTLEDVRIDLGKGAFAPGQLYVALSRAKSIEGLSLVRDIIPSDVQVDTMLVRFLDWAKDASNLDFSTHAGG
jgi:hypothetical protein